MENNIMMPEKLDVPISKVNDVENQVKLKKKGYTKSEKLLTFANQKLEEVENRIGMQLSGFSELYDNMSEEDQKTFIGLLKDAEKEQYKHERTKHPCTRKKKKAPKVKHGNRKKK
jgi:hypothetical protein